MNQPLSEADSPYAAKVTPSGVVARYTGVDDAVRDGAFERLEGSALDAWLQGEGLRVLMFAGPPKRQRDAHDVAIALRELLRSYAGKVHAAVLPQDQEAEEQSRFRVLASPSLALCAGGEVLEVVPGVRDWADYAALFRRYLGDAAHG